MSAAILTVSRHTPPPALGSGRLDLGDPPAGAPPCQVCNVDRAQIELDVVGARVSDVALRRTDPRQIARHADTRRRAYCVPCLEALVALGERAMG